MNFKLLGCDSCILDLSGIRLRFLRYRLVRYRYKFRLNRYKYRLLLNNHFDGL